MTPTNKESCPQFRYEINPWAKCLNCGGAFESHDVRLAPTNKSESGHPSLDEKTWEEIEDGYWRIASEFFNDFPERAQPDFYRLRDEWKAKLKDALSCAREAGRKDMVDRNRGRLK